MNELCESHIVPQFVVRALRRRSTTGFLRAVDRPAQRLQDGFKARLLCEECEQRFSRWEAAAAQGPFASLDSTPEGGAKYDSSFAPFAVSILWRVLVWRTPPFLAVSPQLGNQVEQLGQTWREFLSGHEPTPGDGSCHAVPLGRKLILGIGPALSVGSKRFHRYLERSVDVNLIADDTQVYVYAKLGRLLFFGFLAGEGSKPYRSSRIALRSGILQPGAFELPPIVLASMLLNAEVVFAAVGGLSQRQRQRIDDSIARALDRGRTN